MSCGRPWSVCAQSALCSQSSLLSNQSRLTSSNHDAMLTLLHIFFLYEMCLAVIWNEIGDNCVIPVIFESKFWACWQSSWQDKIQQNHYFHFAPKKLLEYCSEYRALEIGSWLIVDILAIVTRWLETTVQLDGSHEPFKSFRKQIVSEMPLNKRWGCQCMPSHWIYPVWPFLEWKLGKSYIASYLTWLLFNELLTRRCDVVTSRCREYVRSRKYV